MTKEQLIEKKNRTIYPNDLPDIIEGMLKEIAVNNSLTVITVRKIISSQFRLLKDNLRSSRVQQPFEEFKSFRVQFLGSWLPSIYKYKKLKDIMTKKDTNV